MALRDAIKVKHDAAEAHAFTVSLLAGTLPEAAYVDLLANQVQVYQALEARAKRLGLLDTLTGIERFEAMSDDLTELDDSEVKPFDTTAAHLKRLKIVDTNGLLAHMYIMHMGDMYGGQLMKSKVPGSAKRYDFEDRTTLIKNLRELLTDDMADEANAAFGFTLKLFDKIKAKHAL